MRCLKHGISMDYLGKEYGFEQWICPQCQAENQPGEKEKDNQSLAGAVVFHPFMKWLGEYQNPDHAESIP